MVYYARFATPDEVEQVLASTTAPFDYAINENGDILTLTKDN